MVKLKPFNFKCSTFWNKGQQDNNDKKYTDRSNHFCGLRDLKSHRLLKSDENSTWYFLRTV